jgi:SAM-dependent methyltransferase
MKLMLQVNDSIAVSKLYRKRDNCRLCHSKRLDLAIPLAPMPIATPTFRVPGALTDAEFYKEAVPLELYLCADCGHFQLLHVVDPEFLYGNYVYRTSVSVGLGEHFRRSAEALISANNPAPGSLVVEIGSNDGTQLQPFQERGFKVLGIDPARAIAKAATDAGIETLGTFFSAHLARRIREERGAAALILANNVFANVDDLDNIVAGVRELLAPYGVFVVQTQYGADVVERTLLDTIYHEHLSYFHVKPLQKYFAAHGLRLIDVERISTKGGSIRFSVQHSGSRRSVSNNVGRLIADEERRRLYDPAGYRKLVADLKDIRNRLDALVAEAEAAGKTIAGYGVSVGTTTLIPQFGLAGKLSVLFDDDPEKIGFLSGPDYHLRVCPPAEVLAEDPGLIIIFAWRYADLIIAKHPQWRRGGGKFVIPLPEVSVR